MVSTLPGSFQIIWPTIGESEMDSDIAYLRLMAVGSGLNSPLSFAMRRLFSSM